MVYLIFPLFLAWFLGLLKSGFDYVNDLHEKELKAIKEVKEFKKDKALKIECRRVRKFLNPDGSINIKAAKEYIKAQEKREKQKPQYLEFKEI